MESAKLYSYLVKKGTWFTVDLLVWSFHKEQSNLLYHL